MTGFMRNYIICGLYNFKYSVIVGNTPLTLSWRFLAFMLFSSIVKARGVLNLSVSPFSLFLTIFMQSSTIQFRTHAPQYMHSSSVMPTSPLLFQNKALVGQALMQSLHSTPLHVRLSIDMLPSTKNSLTPNGARSSSLRFRFSLSLVSTSRLNMSEVAKLPRSSLAVIQFHLCLALQDSNSPFQDY